MNVKKIDLSKLRNEEHFQFCADFAALVGRYNANNLNIANEFNTFMNRYSKEDDVLQEIRKSDKTLSIAEVDNLRDDYFRGISFGIKSNQFHFNKQKRECANRIAIILDQYGNVAKKSYNQETADISKLVQEATGAYANDFNVLGMMEWIQEIDRVNKQFMEVMRQRDNESADKPLYSMKEIRTEVNEIYYNIIKRIEAVIILNGIQNYEQFVRELNVLTDRYNLTIAQRAGRRAAVEE